MLPVDLAIPTRSGTVHVRATDRSAGSFHLDDVPVGVLEARRRAVVDLPWTLLDEVHGTTVLTVTVPGEHDGHEGDALVTALAGAVLGVWVGDCAPVALVGAGGAVGAVHAGWRGIEAGVLCDTVGALRSLGSGPVRAVLGPCIHPCCYEFGTIELDRLAAVYGPGVVGRARSGAAALDMPAAVSAALARCEVPVEVVGGCTGCDERYWSHRTRGERGRQVMAVWREPA